MRIVTASLIILAFAAGPALAQPTTGTTTPAPPSAPPPPGPPATTSPPPVTIAAPPVTTAPPPTAAPPVETPPVNQPVVQAAPAPPPPVELSGDVPYPNGLGDPVENFARADNDRDGGFPWGLLGLLGLLGLIPWIRGTGPKTIYVEREKPRDPPRE
jgi:hypothetical protein